jgi:uncharacterized Zn finger protein (UPF0148 family)
MTPQKCPKCQCEKLFKFRTIAEGIVQCFDCEYRFNPEDASLIEQQQEVIESSIRVFNTQKTEIDRLRGVLREIGELDKLHVEDPEYHSFAEIARKGLEWK